MSSRRTPPLVLASFALLASPIAASEELTEAQAAKQLLASVRALNAYDLPVECLKSRSLGYKNAGFTFELLADGCLGKAKGEIVGRWRVDARSGETFVEDGRGKFRVPVPRAAAAGPVVREERTVEVGGVAERWQLVWATPPRDACAPDAKDEMWSTCPCDGFAFGESGDLVLVRSRPGAPEERLPLGPLFAGQETPVPKAVLRRWPVQKGDVDVSDEKGFAGRVRSRRPVDVMALGDYDHDGRATEFVLQVGAGPCGHRQSVLVGIDSRNPTLHVFGSAEAPKVPIVLERPSDWEQLRQAKGEVRLVEWACGDHGSEEETVLRVSTDARGIHVQGATSACR